MRNLITHCLRGHEYIPENTYYIPSTGVRQCRICRSQRPRNHKKRPSVPSLKLDRRPVNSNTWPLSMCNELPMDESPYRPLVP